MSDNGFSEYELSGISNSSGDYSGNYGMTRLTSPHGQDETYVFNRDSGGNDDEIGATRNITESSRAGLDNDENRTIIDLPATAKMDPAVGWLVCIEGPDQGKSFRLVRSNNSIGRNGTQTYQVNLTDQKISRKQAVGVIVYDIKKNLFYMTIGGVDAGSNIYLNGAIVLSAKQLQARDRIEIERDTLIFVPFCSDKFAWNFDELEAEKAENAAKPAPEKVEKPAPAPMVNNPIGRTGIY